MDLKKNTSALLLGVSIFAGLSMLGFLLGKSVIQFKEFERRSRSRQER